MRSPARCGRRRRPPPLAEELFAVAGLLDGARPCAGAGRPGPRGRRPRPELAERLLAGKVSAETLVGCSTGGRRGALVAPRDLADDVERLAVEAVIAAGRARAGGSTRSRTSCSASARSSPATPELRSRARPTAGAPPTSAPTLVDVAAATTRSHPETLALAAPGRRRARGGAARPVGRGLVEAAADRREQQIGRSHLGRAADRGSEQRLAAGLGRHLRRQVHAQHRRRPEVIGGVRSRSVTRSSTAPSSAGSTRPAGAMGA